MRRDGSHEAKRMLRTNYVKKTKHCLQPPMPHHVRVSREQIDPPTSCRSRRRAPPRARVTRLVFTRPSCPSHRAVPAPPRFRQNVTRRVRRTAVRDDDVSRIFPSPRVSPEPHTIPRIALPLHHLLQEREVLRFRQRPARRHPHRFPDLAHVFLVVKRELLGFLHEFLVLGVRHRSRHHQHRRFVHRDGHNLTLQHLLRGHRDLQAVG
mmetsp:Transcript_15521/g.50919  ORF Transcript_15521/g.50919 Transcript_15521/m.50919 type:complete len:208 (+) Transcript_15521:878-1501(+)